MIQFLSLTQTCTFVSCQYLPRPFPSQGFFMHSRLATERVRSRVRLIPTAGAPSPFLPLVIYPANPRPHPASAKNGILRFFFDASPSLHARALGSSSTRSPISCRPSTNNPAHTLSLSLYSRTPFANSESTSESTSQSHSDGEFLPWLALLLRWTPFAIIGRRRIT